MPGSVELSPFLAWGNLFLIPLLFLPGSFFLVRVALWLPLGKFKNYRGNLWTEQARLFQPVRLGGVLAVFLGVMLFAFFSLLFTTNLGATDSFYSLLAMFTALVGGWLAYSGIQKTYLPDAPSRGKQLKALAMFFLVLFLPVLLVIIFLFLVPTQFNWTFFGLIFLYLILAFLIQSDGVARVALRLGWFKSVPEELSKPIFDKARELDVDLRAVISIPGLSANALAFTNINVVAFSSRMLENFSPEECLSIAAHELGHLSEPLSVRVYRLTGALTLLPLLFIGPLSENFKHFWVFPLLLLSTLVLVMLHSLGQRRLERRADHIAGAESDPEVYARALTKLYKLRRIPAVLGQKAAHPDLYERILAQGIEPDFPKPAPPPKGPRRFGFLLQLVVSILFFLTVFLSLLFVSLWGKSSGGFYPTAIPAYLSAGNYLFSKPLAKHYAGQKRFSEASLLYQAFAEQDESDVQFLKKAIQMEVAGKNCAKARVLFKKAEKRNGKAFGILKTLELLGSCSGGKSGGGTPSSAP